MAHHIAYLAPSASGSAAMLHGNTEWIARKMHYVLPPGIPIIHQISSVRLWKLILPVKAANRIFAIDSISGQESNSRIGSSCIMVIMIFGRIAAMGVGSL